MVTVLPARQKPPGIMEQLLGGLAHGLPTSLGQLVEKQEQENTYKDIAKTVKDLTGHEVSGREPKEFLSKLIEGHQKQQLHLGDVNDENEAYKTMDQTYGPNFAKVWKAVGKGEGRTNLNQLAFAAKERGEDVNQIFAPLAQQAEQISQMENGENNQEMAKSPLENNQKPKEKYPKFNYRKGRTATEYNHFKDALRKENAPVYQESAKKEKSAKGEKLLIDRVDTLNERKTLPEGLGKAIINPTTGEPFAIASWFGLVNPDTQSFIKTINEFTTKAKDTYGSRVTNFDLQQYMKRLPGLLNTYEGRKNIIQQMKISNKLTDLYEGELTKIYNKYGLDGITQEDAIHMASQNIKEEEDKLIDEYNKIDASNMDISANEPASEERPKEKPERKPVKPGSKLTPDIMKQYLQLSGNDPEVAWKMAQEDGYAG